MIATARRNAWVLVAGVASLVLTVQPFRDTDTWWHLALGRYILAHGIPSVEPFSFAHAPNAWVGQQWLYEVTIAKLVDIGGPGLASIALGAVGAAAFVVAMLSIPAARRPRGPWMAASMLLMCLVAAQLLGVRGQVVTLLGVAIVLCVVARWRRGSTRVLYVLPPLFAIWANLHAGFITGLAVLLVALVVIRAPGRAARRALLLALVASTLATLINPAGPGLWGYVASTFDNSTLTSVVTEWMSPDFHDAFLRLFEVSAIALLVAWFLAPERDPFDLVLAALTFVAALQAQRNVSLFAVVAAPQLALYGSAAWGSQRHRLARRTHRALQRPPAWFGAALAVVVIAGTAAAVAPQLTRASAATYESTHEPEAAATFVASHLAGRRIFSTDTIGGYLAYRFPAGRVVYLYDETAIFGASLLQQYLTVAQLKPGWPALFTDDGITVAILPAQLPEVSALLAIAWQPACRDAASGTVVLVAGSGSPSTDPATLTAAPDCAG